MERSTFLALFEHSSIGIIISNQEGVIEKCNPFAAKIFGYGPTELNGQAIEVLLPNHLRKKHVSYRKSYNENPGPRSMGSSLNLMALKKNGEQFPVEISLSFFENDGYRQIVSFINDITERKRGEDEYKKLTEELESKVQERTKELSDTLLELSFTNENLKVEMEQRKKMEEKIRHTLEKEMELNEIKSRFVSMASHEFRTPLSRILTSSNLIARYEKTEDLDKRTKHLQTINHSVKNLTAILNDFLSLDKLEQGKVETNPVTFSLNDFVKEMVEEFKDFSEKSHHFLIEQKKELSIHQDKEMLRNILTNLLSNAIKYSPEGKNIFLEIGAHGSQATIMVRDEGIGIAESEQKHLFQRFFRGHNAVNIQGTGLGLNIVKRYLDLMGGQIEFSSVVNKGTTFTVTLPMGKKT